MNYFKGNAWVNLVDSVIIQKNHLLLWFLVNVGYVLQLSDND